MTDDGGYDLKPAEPRPAPERSSPPPPSSPADDAPRLKPGDPGWTPPVPIIEKADPAEADDEPAADPDVEQFKGLAILAYICFVIPLVAAPNSKFARFHANQGLLTFLALIAVTVGVALLMVARSILAMLLQKVALLEWFFYCGLSLLSVAMLLGWIALVIQGILNAANGDEKELPVVGHFKLIK
jgi:uncharacterized membrane protein